MRGMRGRVVPVILPMAFLGSCVGFLSPAVRIADPMTHRPVVNPAYQPPFPVLVVAGDTAWVSMVEYPYDVPAPPAGASYLVPIAKARELEGYIRSHDTTDEGRSWVLQAKDVSRGRQRIELVRVGDGFWGGVYDATSTTVVPQYRKITGPGFAFVFGPLAFALNLLSWTAAWAAYTVIKRARTRAQKATGRSNDHA
jgi:hypothetical protein